MFRATLKNLTKFRLYTGNVDCTLCEVAKENLNKLNLKYENFNIYDNNNVDAAYWRELYKVGCLILFSSIHIEYIFCLYSMTCLYCILKKKKL